ncbi:MAG: globin domain-containing protein, partial [Gammaproteobacteria bacterium]|nr:globin domain-containing protein [Gammaproteobacteria bacterium]
MSQQQGVATAQQQTGLNVDVLESSFNALAPNGEAITRKFYEELFNKYPAVKPLFANTSIEEQHKKLWAALKLVAGALRKPDQLMKALKDLGKRHGQFGAQPEHYQAVAETLLGVMQEFAGDLWTNEVQQAWQQALETIATVMIEADKEEKMMATNQTEMASASNDELTQMRAAVDGAMTAIMMVDRDLKITYANRSTVKLLTQHEQTLRSIYPGFDVNNLVGTCVDMFHKNPAHQRQLLSNPANLPYQADIQVGPLKFSLNVTAMVDSAGNYMGNCLEWMDVTETRKKETEVKRLQSAVEASTTNLMMCDADLNITYANPAVVNMLKAREMELRKVWPSLDTNNLLGQNIDQFHKNPAHQRALLSDRNRLPARAEIKVGDLEFEVNATFIEGPNGEYMGNMVEWKDLTESNKQKREVARLTSAVEGAASNLMMCDQDLNITYANPAVVNMLAKREAELRKVWPSLDTKNIIGQNIDQFHKNPAHQRALLADASRLPAKAEIVVG